MSGRTGERLPAVRSLRCQAGKPGIKRSQDLAVSKIGVTFVPGKMAEWSIAAVLKTVELQGSGGSNPSLSAPGFDERLEFQPLYCVCGRQKIYGFVGGEINPGASSAQKTSAYKAEVFCACFAERRVCEPTHQKSLLSRR